MPALPLLDLGEGSQQKLSGVLRPSKDRVYF